MGKIMFFAGVIVLLLVLIGFMLVPDDLFTGRKGGITVVESMELKSPAFTENGRIPIKYTCDGDDVNPSLEIGDVPKNTKSLALIIDDPDAPSGTWVHWILWNIDDKTKVINENSVPSGAVQGLNSFDKHDYGGPCPPSGEHRYFFKIFALNKNLDLDSNSNGNDVQNAMEGNIIAKKELVGLYSRG